MSGGLNRGFTVDEVNFTFFTKDGTQQILPVSSKKQKKNSKIRGRLYEMYISVFFIHGRKRDTYFPGTRVH